LAGSGEEERKGKAAGRGEICGGAGPGEAEGGGRRRKEGDGGGADRWGRLVSETKRKGAGSVGCRGEKVGGLLGRRAGRGEGKFSLFFSFSNSFQTKLLNSKSNQISFKSFTKFYNLFKSHTSNQKPCKAK
jgi:hypothetical protein